MSLNIKNEGVCALAREVALRTGQTQTGAIASALERYLAHILRAAEEGRRARIDATLRRIHADLTEQDRAAIRRRADDLYDPETGLPA